MGKYSIDSFERYPQLIWRPEALASPPPVPGYGLLTLEEMRASTVLPLVSLQDVDRHIDQASQPFALLLDLRTLSRLDIAEALARHGLQRRWQRAPVYALLPAAPDAVTLADLQRWHVRAADQAAGLCPDIRPRRVTCPQIVSSGGALPLRLWLTNAGSSPLYEPARLHLRLSGPTAQAILPLDHPADLFLTLGDLVHNQILSLPPLPPGLYETSLALLTPDGQPLPLNASAPDRAGYTPLGPLPLDTQPRPDYFHIWDDYYPEGYYPLEDPKEPKAGE